MSSPDQQFLLAWLHPRYWLIWLLFAFMAALAQLPYRWQMSLGIVLGRLAYRFASRRRYIAQRNIELCFPEWDAEKRETFVYRHFETMGLTMIEMGMAWFMPKSRLYKRFTVSQRENIDRLLEQKTGMIVVGGHFNVLEMCNVMGTQLFDAFVTYRPHDNPVFDWVQGRRRQRHNPNTQIVDRYDVRGMIKALRRGGILWYAPDQDFGRKVSEFVPFFGIPAATVAATPKLLQMGKAVFVLVEFCRKPDLSGYDICFHPADERLPSGEDYEDLVYLNRLFEQRIRENPLEYLWTHRRFKTRPEGDESLYPGLKRKKRQRKK